MGTSVAEVVVETLVKMGVKRIYGIPGDSIDPLMDAIRRNGKLQYVQVRHEEGAALEAAFEAKLTHEPVACMGTSGPGSIHLLNGLYEAKMDHAPVIALTGQVETDLQGHDYFQEVNINKLFDDVSLFNAQIANPDNAEYLVWRACRESKVKGGVSHLALPVDVLRMDSKSQGELSFDPMPVPDYSIDASVADRLIDQSRKPLIFIGRGALGMTEELDRLAERIGAPIIYALNGKGIVDDADPKVVGTLGLLGTKSSVEAMKRTDLILFLGTSFPYHKFLPKGVKSIQVDMDPLNIGKRFHSDVPYVCTVEKFLESINPKEKDNKFYREMSGFKEDWISDMRKIEEDDAKPIKPERVAATLARHAARDAVVVVDTGNVTVWGLRNFRSGTGHTYLFSPWLGSMGVGIPGAVGASFATDRQVIALVGDGSFAMTMMELITARKYGRNVKIVVFNNSKLGMIKFEQEVMGYPEWGVDLLNPDFAALAESIGLTGIGVDEPGELEGKIKQFLSVKGPAVLDVKVDGDERPMPPRLNFTQVKGYITSLFREELMSLSD